MEFKRTTYVLLVQCATNWAIKATALISQVLRPRAKPSNNHYRVTLISQLVEHCTINAQVMDYNPVQNLKSFLGRFSSSVMAASISINYCWTSITII